MYSPYIGGISDVDSSIFKLDFKGFLINPLHDVLVHGVAQINGHSVAGDFHEEEGQHSERQVDCNEADEGHLYGDKEN